MEATEPTGGTAAARPRAVRPRERPVARFVWALGVSWSVVATAFCVHFVATTLGHVPPGGRWPKTATITVMFDATLSSVLLSCPAAIVFLATSRRSLARSLPMTVCLMLLSIGPMLLGSAVEGWAVKAKGLVSKD